ncbi:hypothetical protein SDC9_104931 [bioreactor metagenome]|uniref:Uncharacterized protein n=1 Tax=bioreactor metagenome TaxID=1076179 RepID=A0A645AXV7_9ZZZZ
MPSNRTGGAFKRSRGMSLGFGGRHGNCSGKRDAVLPGPEADRGVSLDRIVVPGDEELRVLLGQHFDVDLRRAVPGERRKVQDGADIFSAVRIHHHDFTGPAVDDFARHGNAARGQRRSDQPEPRKNANRQRQSDIGQGRLGGHDLGDGRIQHQRIGQIRVIHHRQAALDLNFPQIGDVALPHEFSNVADIALDFPGNVGAELAEDVIFQQIFGIDRGDVDIFVLLAGVADIEVMKRKQGTFPGQLRRVGQKSGQFRRVGAHRRLH